MLSVLSSNISEYLVFTIFANNSFSNATNSTQMFLNDRYFNFTGRLDMAWQFLERLIFRTEGNYQNYQGLSESYNQQYALWNLSFGTKFLEDDRGEVSLKVYDLLNQNNNIQRNVTSTYVEDVKTNVLQRYLMISFTYNFRNFKGQEKELPEMRPPMMGPPGWERD